MKEDIPVKNGIVIPGHELDITTSRAGGPGGQHVNKTSTRITVRWNIKKSTALTDEQKERALINLDGQLTSDGDLIVHNSSTRSQQQNKKLALDHLAQKVRKSLYVPKKRMKTKMPKTIKEKILKKKKRRSEIKKMRGTVKDY